MEDSAEVLPGVGEQAGDSRLGLKHLTSVLFICYNKSRLLFSHHKERCMRKKLIAIDTSHIKPCVARVWINRFGHLVLQMSKKLRDVVDESGHSEKSEPPAPRFCSGEVVPFSLSRACWSSKKANSGPRKKSDSKASLRGHHKARMRQIRREHRMPAEV